jgi:hypothetical protein
MTTDGWKTLSDLALRVEGRDRKFKSRDLRNLGVIGEGRHLAARASLSELFPEGDGINSDLELDLAIADLIERAKVIASHMRLKDAMEVTHQVGMAMHGSAQR